MVWDAYRSAKSKVQSVYMVDQVDAIVYLCWLLVVYDDNVSESLEKFLKETEQAFHSCVRIGAYVTIIVVRSW